MENEQISAEQIPDEDMSGKDVPWGSGTHASASQEKRSRKKRDEPPEDTTWILTGPTPSGPEIPDLIPNFAVHVAIDMWRRDEVILNLLFILFQFKLIIVINLVDLFLSLQHGVVKCHHRVNYMTIQQRPTHPDAVRLLEDTGLYHLRCWNMSKLNAPLLCAFIERWQPDTNTFHMHAVRRYDHHSPCCVNDNGLNCGWTVSRTCI